MNVFVSFFVAIGKNIAKFFAKKAQAAVNNFLSRITPDLIAIMQDAISYVATLPLNDTSARDAAIAKFKTDASVAGHDISTWAKNELNAFLELVYVGAKTSV